MVVIQFDVGDNVHGFTYFCQDQQGPVDFRLSCTSYWGSNLREDMHLLLVSSTEHTDKDLGCICVAGSCSLTTGTLVKSILVGMLDDSHLPVKLAHKILLCCVECVSQPCFQRKCDCMLFATGSVRRLRRRMRGARSLRTQRQPRWQLRPQRRRRRRRRSARLLTHVPSVRPQRACSKRSESASGSCVREQQVRIVFTCSTPGYVVWYEMCIFTSEPWVYVPLILPFDTVRPASVR